MIPPTHPLVERISSITSVSPRDILGKSRRPHHVRARRQLMAALRRLRYPLQEIGEMLGVHHTTVLHGLRVAEGERQGESVAVAEAKAREMERYDLLAEHECL